MVQHLRRVSQRFSKVFFETLKTLEAHSLRLGAVHPVFDYLGSKMSASMVIVTFYFHFFPLDFQTE
jgi:hypothetical protein